MDQFSSHPLYRKHNLDSVMSTLWSFYTRKFVALFIFSFIMSLGIQFLSLTFNIQELIGMTDLAEMMEKIRGWIWPAVGISLISLLFLTILHYYVIYNPVDSNVSIFVAVYKSLKYFFPYLIIMVLFVFMASVAMVFGLMVLIIGVVFAMLYMMTLYLFILPILMVEGPDIANAISRSFRFTHRGFWSNIGWVAVFCIILIIVSTILSTLILLPFAGSFLNILTNPQDVTGVTDFMTNPVYIILSALTSALFYPLLPIFATILYFNGKAREEEVNVPDQDLTTLS
jgi:hypothetical protein